MWLLLSISIGSLLGSSCAATPFAPSQCFDHVCYERGCLRTDTSNITSGAGICTPTAGQLCAIKVSTNATYYEVTASCETNCQPAGNKASDTAVYCCNTTACNNDEAKIPDAPNPNAASLLSLKWTLIVVQILFVFFTPYFFFYN